MKFNFKGISVNYIILNFKPHDNEKKLHNRDCKENLLKTDKKQTNKIISKNKITKKQNKIPVLFLHGWGGSIDSFMFCTKALNDTPCILIDFPPFGQSSEPLEPWTVKDYTELVINICNQLNIKKVNIVAHSFGGRVAIELASKTNMVKNMLLTGSAGLKKKSFKVIIKERIYKLQKFLSKLNLYSKNKLLCRGSDDYKNLSEVMKKTFVNIVNYDQTKLLAKINVPTLLVWGKLDKQTPFYFTKIFKKHIKDCEVVSFDGLGHFAYLQKPNTFIQIIKKFFKDN